MVKISAVATTRRLFNRASACAVTSARKSFDSLGRGVDIRVLEQRLVHDRVVCAFERRQ